MIQITEVEFDLIRQVLGSVERVIESIESRGAINDGCVVLPIESYSDLKSKVYALKEFVPPSSYYEISR